MHTFAILAWAMTVRGVSPLARLLAFKFGDYPAYDEDINVRVPIRALVDWSEADYDHVLVALDELRAVGVVWSDGGDGTFVLKLPLDARPQFAAPEIVRSVPMWVYVFTGADCTKIGISVDPASRLANLQSAQPSSPLRSIFTYQAEANVIRQVERVAHEKMVHALISNEWFRATPEECIAAVKAAILEVTGRNA